MEQYTTFTTNKKGHLLVHPVLASIIILLALISGIIYVYIKVQADKVIVVDVVEDISETEPIAEISFTENQTLEEKKSMVFNRFSTVYLEPLSLKERQAVLAEFGDTNKTNLTESEKRQLIKALNTY